MKENIKVSVIIPVYGVERFIDRCARSLFNQTMTDGIEFIFVDDCTKDKSFEVLKRTLADFPDRESQVTIIHHEVNKGLPQARKTGVLASKGEYIAHCDSDDWVEPTIYQVMYDKAISENADIVCCNYYNSDGITKNVVRVRRDLALLAGPVWNKLVRSSLYNDYDIDYPIANKAEDGALMAQLSFFARKISYIDEPLNYYFQNSESICRVMTEESMLKRLDEEKANVDLRVNFLIRHNAIEQYGRTVVRWKKACRTNLYPYMNKRKYRKMWRKTYPEINRQFLLDPQNSVSAKLFFLLDYCGLHNTYEQIRKLFCNN